MSGRRRMPKVAVMETMCPACGRRADVGDRFCAACGASLGAASVPGHEERKTVTAVFVDLVGWTERAGRLDPEEARALLGGYWDGVREELERRGGTVEKFIGDAVVGLFGAPTAHEDDAERAVRAALAVRERAHAEEWPRLRIGVATGPALVRVDAHPEQGEAMVVGDVVNLGARLQAAAPEDGVLVDGPTREATRDAVRYGDRRTVAVKGRQAPVPVWEPREVEGPPGCRPRLGVRFVGRALELALLGATLDRVARDRAVQLVTLVGAPGIGKSRLVEQLAAVTPLRLGWWHGRSIPYGDGVTFWAFGEAVKAAAGIAGDDGRAAARTKLGALVASVVPEDERAWICAHVLRLAGVGDGEVESRVESFAAWRRLVECAASERPLVLVLEDLQWADDGLLDLVEHLVEWAAGVPLLVLATARPELLERRPSWGGGTQNALTLTLGPLSGEETTALLADVLGVGVNEELVARTGGNPLYAEQFARMLRDDPGARGRLPDSVQGIVAARLDRVGQPDKSVLLDAAVIGASFERDALAAVAGVDEQELDTMLHRIERTQLVSRVGTEYVFAHRLVCDVAYEQIPRAARAEKHVRLARWIEQRDRLGDEAELAAHHYMRARKYRVAAGLDTHDIDEPARLALVQAGERALALNAFVRATELHAAALELWPDDVAGRERVLLRHAQATWSARSSGEEIAEQARDGLLAAGDVDGAAEAEVLLSEMRWYGGDRAGAAERLDAALALVSDRPASRAKGAVVARLARSCMLAGQHADAICHARAALELARTLGLVELEADVLNTIGSARFRSGDSGGIEDLERAIALAPNSRAAVVAWNNLSSIVMEAGDRKRSRECTSEGRRLAERLGDRLHVVWFGVSEAGEQFIDGRWDDALATCERELALLGPGHYLAASVRLLRCTIRQARGESLATDELRVAEEEARAAGDPQVLVPTLARCAFLSLQEGRRAEAERLADEVVRACLEAGAVPPLATLDLSLTLLELDRAADVERLLDSARMSSRWFDIARMHARGDLDGAAALADELDGGWGAAYIHLRAARRGGRGAAAHAARALAYYRAVGAERYVRELTGRRSRSPSTTPASSSGSRRRADASASRTSGAAAPRRRGRRRDAPPPAGAGRAPSP